MVAITITTITIIIIIIIVIVITIIASPVCIFMGEESLLAGIYHSLIRGLKVRRPSCKEIFTSIS